MTVKPAMTMETIDISLIKMFSDGPEVSLKGSPTVSPTTVAWWDEEFLPPKWPSSTYFFALSQARVVPGTAGIGQEDGEDEARAEAAGQEADHGGGAKQRAHQHRHHNREDAREDHLVLGRLGGNAYAGGIIRPLLSFQDTRNLAELAADLHDHLFGRAAHGVHRQTAEQEGHHRADENTHEHLRIHQ